MYYIINCTSKEHPNKAFCTTCTLKYKLIICSLFHDVSISLSSALMIGCLVDDKLGRKWKETAVA